MGSEIRRQAAGGIKHFNVTKEGIADNIIKVANMEPVAEMTGKEFPKGEKKLSEQVNDYYGTLGNVAHNDTIGDVELDYGTIMDDISHGVGRKKAISFKAVPYVIEKGKIIDTKLNRENREYDTVAIAAPITIGNDGYIMGAIIRRIPSIAIRKGAPGAQRHYVHEVMIEKISADFKTGQANSPGAGVNTDSSMGSLLYDIVEVKNGTLKKDELLNRIFPDEGRFSLKTTQRVQPFDITKDKILENMKMVTGMSPVVTLDGSGFKKQEGRSLSQAVMDYYGGKEFYVNNPTIGEVKVGRRGIKAGTQHKLYGSKIEGFKALREVIEDGYVINISQDYKNDGTDRVILAAPIEIDSNVYYMGAVINRAKSNNIQNYYIHDVVLEEKKQHP